jgi:UDP-N-acetylmuramyl pentapeptide phosphotransferase/UDP-N-acetylglucosamine-1-phosphate transferase
MIALLLGFGISLCTTFFIIRSARTHSRFSGDVDMSGPQKFHSRPVPRVGGLGILVGLSAALVALWIWQGVDMTLGVTLLACSAPAFLAGLAEDLTKAQSPRRRLFFTAVSASLAAWALGAVIDRTDIPGVDWIVSFAIPAVFITVFMVAGMANAVNIIDGFNGLAAMCVVMMLGAIAYVAFQAQDRMILLCALAGLGAVLGFFVWNFPAGLIFLGDGGAYFLGFYVGELSILLVHRNPQVSPLCPLLMCMYPIFETLFSIYRKKVLRGMSPGVPDGIHLHMLVYKRLMRWSLGVRTAKVLTRRNSMTSPYLWFLCMLAVIPSMLFWNNSAWLGGFIFLFGITYVLLYWSIVRFRVPDWLIVRH